ncbi:MAG: GNAT family N-acetyltransferase [Firmicutes bacterium]|nr:GNAT family N-acetyltransferase [Bacillota bacterium]
MRRRGRRFARRGTGSGRRAGHIGCLRRRRGVRGVEAAREAASWPLGFLRFEELAEVAEIEARVFPEPLDLPSLARLWLTPGTVYLAIRDGERLAAYFSFQVQGPTAHVIANATRPEYQGRGLGHRILREAEPVARSRGARWFLGEVRRSNLRQLAVLRELGWVEVGRCPRFFGNGEEAVVVWRCLP